MANPILTLDGVSCVLPDGRSLFTDLSALFDQRHTGLVGRNGVGKSMLARILTGEHEPTSGFCRRMGRVHYLPQQPPGDSVSVSALAGFAGVIAALERIENGRMDAHDFDVVDGRWDIRERLHAALRDEGLGYLDAASFTSALSGGEAMRVALLGARLADADLLILDEPSNHLDGSSRTSLMAWISAWQRGLLVVSHDRALLEPMERIVELSSQGLRSYGGGYTFYAQAREAEQHHALEHLERRKTERKREQRALCEQEERLARRQARGTQHARQENQSRLLLGLRKQRSESTAGKLKAQIESARETLSQRVAEAALQAAHDTPVAVLGTSTAYSAQRKVAILRDAELPYARHALRKIDLTLLGRQRVGVIGPNGSGKSTLLKLLSGQWAPLGGRCDVPVRTAWLDQRLSTLDPARSLHAQMRDANPGVSEDVLRMRLALLGLDTEAIMRPSDQLSGGERLKAALALALQVEQPAQLLLLDEPGNHLDLVSLHALETRLTQYEGALVVVSHDQSFLDGLQLTDRLEATASGWQMTPW